MHGVGLRRSTAKVLPRPARGSSLRCTGRKETRPDSPSETRNVNHPLNLEADGAPRGATRSRVPPSGERGSKAIPVNEFLHTALTFPTVVYSMLLAVTAIYWLLASTGLADGDAVDAFMGGDGDGDAVIAAAMLGRLGLGGIPLMVVATVFGAVAWLGTYFVQLLALPRVPEELRTVAGVAVMLGMLVTAALATSVALRPVGRRLAKMEAAATPSLLGQTAVIITPSLSGEYGQASVDDGGAGLILQVRHDAPNTLKRGDRIVLIEYIEGQNAYRVVSEQQFLAPTSAPQPQLGS